ncbi:12032_t:CDS:1, partial [Dentiscutata erythropus]
MPKEKKKKKEKKDEKERFPTPEHILETYPEPEKSDDESAKERSNRLKRKRQAKYMHYQKLNQ